MGSVSSDAVAQIEHRRGAVAGDGADNISKQSGGWTLTWQGVDLTNKDFPNAQSIFEGIKEAVAAAGGTATLSVDGKYRRSCLIQRW